MSVARHNAAQSRAVPWFTVESHGLSLVLPLLEPAVEPGAAVSVGGDTNGEEDGEAPRTPPTPEHSDDDAGSRCSAGGSPLAVLYHSDVGAGDAPEAFEATAPPLQRTPSLPAFQRARSLSFARVRGDSVTAVLSGGRAVATPDGGGGGSVVVGGGGVALGGPAHEPRTDADSDGLSLVVCQLDVSSFLLSTAAPDDCTHELFSLAGGQASGDHLGLDITDGDAVAAFDCAVTSWRGLRIRLFEICSADGASAAMRRSDMIGSEAAPEVHIVPCVAGADEWACGTLVLWCHHIVHAVDADIVAMQCRVVAPPPWPQVAVGVRVGKLVVDIGSGVVRPCVALANAWEGAIMNPLVRLRLHATQKAASATAVDAARVVGDAAGVATSGGVGPGPTGAERRASFRARRNSSFAVAPAEYGRGRPVSAHAQAVARDRAHAAVHTQVLLITSLEGASVNISGHGAGVEAFSTQVLHSNCDGRADTRTPIPVASRGPADASGAAAGASRTGRLPPAPSPPPQQQQLVCCPEYSEVACVDIGRVHVVLGNKETSSQCAVMVNSVLACERASRVRSTLSSKELSVSALQAAASDTAASAASSVASPCTPHRPGDETTAQGSSFSVSRSVLFGGAGASLFDSSAVDALKWHPGQPNHHSSLRQRLMLAVLPLKGSVADVAVYCGSLHARRGATVAGISSLPRGVELPTGGGSDGATGRRDGATGGSGTDGGAGARGRAPAPVVDSEFPAAPSAAGSDAASLPRIDRMVLESSACLTVLIGMSMSVRLRPRDSLVFNLPVYDKTSAAPARTRGLYQRVPTSNIAAKVCC